MSNESKVVIAPDNSSGGAHSVRTETATPFATGVAVEQQVVTIADQDGNLLDLKANALPVYINEETTRLLKAICLRLDILNAAVHQSYSPPDNLPYED